MLAEHPVIEHPAIAPMFFGQLQDDHPISSQVSSLLVRSAGCHEGEKT